MASPLINIQGNTQSFVPSRGPIHRRQAKTASKPATMPVKAVRCAPRNPKTAKINGATTTGT